MTTLPHVVWDMGGILYRYFTEMMVDVGRREGWPLDRIPMGPTGDIDDPGYQLMIEGKLDEPEYVQGMIAALQANGIEFDPPRDLDWSGQERAETWETIGRIATAKRCLPTMPRSGSVPTGGSAGSRRAGSML